MDLALEQPDYDDKAHVKRGFRAAVNDRIADILWLILYSPLRLFLEALRLLRPFSPQLIPLFVCLLLIPGIVFLSVSAGWFVWRSVAVGWESQLYLQYGDGTPPYAEISLPPLVPRQLYDISLHLAVPATESNFALGNFMASLTLSTPSNKTLTSIRRPAIATPPSFGLLSLLSGRPGAIHLEVPLLSSYAPGTSRVVAKIDLGRRDGWRSIGNGEGREISVLSAILKGTIKHHGVRGLVTRFPLLFSAISTITFLAVSLLVLAACLLPAIEWRLDRDPSGSGDVNDTKPKTLAFPPEDDTGDEKPSRRRRKSRGRRSRAMDVKAEAPSAVMPTAGPSTQSPLRRRRSQFSDRSTDE